MAAQARQVADFADGVYWLPLGIANVYFVRSAETWSLVDTALPGNAKRIVAAAETLLGAGAAPASILLTHAHLDHSGSALDLARRWRRPVYLDSEEMPFVDGTTLYPPPDPSVGGFMAAMSRFPVRRLLDLEDTARLLGRTSPPPGLPDWQCVFTPGHSPGLHHGQPRFPASGASDLQLACRERVHRASGGLGAARPCLWPWRVPRGQDTARLLREFSSGFHIPTRGLYISG